MASSPRGMKPRPPSRRPRIVIVDMAVTRQSPAGSCVLAEVEGLLRDHDVTVFAERIEASLRPRVEFVKVWAPWQPVALRYAVFHLLIRWQYARWRRNRPHADVVQATQGQLPACDIAYAHFCHSAYLSKGLKYSSASGARRWARWATHALNAWAEGVAFARAKVIVVPSHGLRREIAAVYPGAESKLHVIANPVDIDSHVCPIEFDRDGQRRELGVGRDDIVLVFMALGDFARKGLGLLIEALAASEHTVRSRLRLLVVGGAAREVAEYSATARRLGIDKRLHCTGMQTDVRPFLWAGDVFAFPSSYEVFPLAVLQAAASGLPAMISEGLYGAAEFVVDGRNGWVVHRQVDDLRLWMRRIVAEHHLLPDMSRAAVASVEKYGLEQFRGDWAALLKSLALSETHEAKGRQWA